VPALGWSGDPPLAEERVFPSFRLYARTIYEVAGLASALTEAGQRVKTSAAEIETVRSIDRNLALLFWVIAAAGMAGYSLSLGASLWANTDRKRRELSVLRLLAFRGGREEVQRHEKTDGLPGREVGRQHAVDDPFEEQVHEHRAELPEDRGEERVEAR